MRSGRMRVTRFRWARAYDTNHWTKRNPDALIELDDSILNFKDATVIAANMIYAFAQADAHHAIFIWYDIENFDYASLLGTTFTMDKAQRISTFDSGSTHAMTLTAVDLDAEGKATKWKVENSWGATWGQQGCLIMSDRWFREFMFRLVVDKKYVPEAILKAAETEPVMVMPEDPLFQPED